MESEFVGVSQNDDCRMSAVLSATALEQHPLSTFMWGNKRSLWSEPLERGTAIRERILQHWKSFYSASCMNLVVMGGESLDVLEEYVTEDFGPVRYPLPVLCVGFISGATVLCCTSPGVAQLAVRCWRTERK